MFHKIEDKRVNCISIMTEMSIDDYLSLVDRVYNRQGGIDGQRAALKTKTALAIRGRLVADLVAGAVIPPIVLGYLASKNDMEAFKSASDFLAISQYIETADEGKISIIDGMQRTTALIDARKSDPQSSTKIVRVEFWIAEKVNSLIYRMLVLNTGQVPWDIGRQLETVYSQFIKQLQDALGGEAEIFLLEDNRRRSQGGQYQSKSVVELLLIFSSRKSEVDIKERISEDFARLDAIEASSNVIFIDQFIATLRMLVLLDKAISRLDPTGQPNREGKRIRNGRDVFGSFPAMAGFCAAISIHAFDEPGFEIDWSTVGGKISHAEHAIGTIIKKLETLTTPDQLNAFLQIELLEEKLSQRSGQVGRFEREFFRKAFTALIKNAERMPDMAPCWKAH